MIALKKVTYGVNEHNKHPGIKPIEKRMKQLDIPKFCCDFV